MKIHTPLFVLGLLVLVTPIVGLPQLYEQIILAAFGVAIMLLVSSVRIMAKLKDKTQNEIFHESIPENKIENE